MGLLRNVKNSATIDEKSKIERTNWNFGIYCECYRKSYGELKTKIEKK